MRIALGQFIVSSGELVVADPCHELNRESTVMGVASPVRNGTWQAVSERMELENWGEACASLIAFHTEHGTEDGDWVKCPFIVGAVSGQAGIFDRESYRVSRTESGHEAAGSQWYTDCCHLIEARDSGVIPGGTVSRTGMGAGTYGAYYRVDAQQQVVGVKIIFLRQPDR
ncbi:DUF4241 domain-containing protein [Paenibacillus sp. SYP-B4298]|uniref:DUF4241 domain-containing protein n=1 Tax=Paenibacillus sp. SYP-B4298 TaxID=2996034 RepID=UPI0022DDEBA7|nr:DUF4241 domain-containing protein [Paenibacillus sp. SYP-B4298]